MQGYIKLLVITKSNVNIVQSSINVMSASEFYALTAMRLAPGPLNALSRTLSGKLAPAEGGPHE